MFSESFSKFFKKFSKMPKTGKVKNFFKIFKFCFLVALIVKQYPLLLRIKTLCKV